MIFNLKQITFANLILNIYYHKITHNLKKIFILFFIASSLVTCKKAEKTFIKVNDNPLIEYYKIGDNIEIFSSDFKMGSEEELNEKAIKLIINGNYEDGEIKLLKALSINPNSSIVLNNLGNLKR